MTWFFPDKLISSAYSIRICPPRKGGKFCFNIRHHSIGELSAGTSTTFQCYKSFEAGKWTGECPICDQYSKLLKTHGDDLGNISTSPANFRGTTREFSNCLLKLRPIEAYNFNVIVRGQEELGVRKWRCHKSIYATIVEGIVGNINNVKVPKLGDITDPFTGHDLAISYTPIPTLDGQIISDSRGNFLPTSRLGTDDQIKEWLSQLHDLTSIRDLKSEIEIKHAMEDCFGYLNLTYSKQKYRNIDEPFCPSW